MKTVVQATATSVIGLGLTGVQKVHSRFVPYVW
jgi:hypothetical protein